MTAILCAIGVSGCVVDERKATYLMSDDKPLRIDGGIGVKGIDEAHLGRIQNHEAKCDQGDCGEEQ